MEGSGSPSKMAIIGGSHTDDIEVQKVDFKNQPQDLNTEFNASEFWKKKEDDIDVDALLAELS